MTSISLEFYLLLVILVLTAVSLLLILFDALLLLNISKKIELLRRSQDSHGEGEEVRETNRVENTIAPHSDKRLSSEFPQRRLDNINDGILTIARNYHLDSLVVAMSDGFVVASAGSPDPEYDAAYYSSLFDGTLSMPEQGVWLLPVYHRGISLVGVVKNGDPLSKETISLLAEEIKSLFARGL